MRGRMVGMPVDHRPHFQFQLRHLLWATAIVAFVLGGWAWFARAQMEADRRATKQAYIYGRLTLEQARESTGADVDKWPVRPNKSAH
jgi:cytochrome c-type biogenesis protein CcmH/NrfF